MYSLRQRIMTLAVGVAAALVIVTVAIGPFLTPAWVAFEQDRARAPLWTGFSATDLRTATDSILADLVFGPPDFDVAVAGATVLNERERGHMRDVRTVFLALWLAAALSAVVLLTRARAARAPADRSAFWRAVDRGAVVVGVGVVVLGIVALVAFDTLFDIFHTLFFPAGSFTFDPRSERLVQLFPFQFWQETTIVVGVVVLAIAAVVAVVARQRAGASGTERAPDTVAPATSPG